MYLLFERDFGRVRVAVHLYHGLGELAHEDARVLGRLGGKSATNVDRWDAEVGMVRAGGWRVRASGC